jgi:putative transport protein
MAAIIVILGALITIAIYMFGDVPMSVAVGLFSGGTTNTPSLAAAQQALQSISGLPADVANQPALGYAVAYPFGIIGIIITMLMIQFGLKVNPAKEAEKFQEEQKANNVQPVYEDVDVQNANIDGKALEEIGLLQESGAVITRILQGNHLHTARPDTVLRVGDTVRLVGPKEVVEELRLLIGPHSEHNLREHPSNIVTKKIVVTHEKNARKTVQYFAQTYDVVISRISRTSEVEFTPGPDVRMQYGDQLTVVGSEQQIQALAKFLGNSMEKLNYPEILPIFVGIALGVLLGSVPFNIPGFSEPIKLGLAGGPLLVAIFLSAKGSIGNMSWHLPKSSNLILREIGIVLFLAAVGLNAGGKFVHTLMDGDGFYWMGMAVFITLVPLVLIGFIGRLVYKVNFMTLCGVLAGSMTDPPALAFANAIATSNAPSISYATVYPLVMILRIISAQVLVQFFVHPANPLTP